MCHFYATLSGRRLGYFQFAKDDFASPNRRGSLPISERNQGEPRSLLASGRGLTQPVQPQGLRIGRAWPSLTDAPSYR